MMDNSHNNTVLECAWCSRNLKTRPLLVAHLKTCKLKECKEVRHECEVCHRKFTSRTGLRLHAKKEHCIVAQRNTTFESKFECTYCPTKFSTKRGLQKHEQRKHENERAERLREQEAELIQSKQLFDCVYCNKHFTRKVNRKKHELNCKKRTELFRTRQTHSVVKYLFYKLFLENHIPYSQPYVYFPLLDFNLARRTTDASLSSTRTTECPIRNTLTQCDEEAREERNIEETPIQRDEEPPAEGNTEGMPSSTYHFLIGRSDTTPSHVDPTMSPNLKAHIRDRPLFLKLRTPDMATPRRARMNLRYGQKTIEKYTKKIRLLQQDNRRLRDKIVTLKDLIVHLREGCVSEHRIADSVADILTVSIIP